MAVHFQGVATGRWARAAALVALLATVTACSHDTPVPVPSPVTAKTPCGDLTHAGFPALALPLRSTYFVCKPQGFALQFNPATKTSLWVAEHVVGATLASPPIAYSEDVRPDPDLPADLRSEMYDFAKSKWAMWQMAPAKDFGGNRVAINRSFYLSNMLPVPLANRKGILDRLELNIRQWAQQYGDLYVVTGPIYLEDQAADWIGGPPPRTQGVVRHRYTTENDPKHPHKNKLGVPHYVFKVLYAPAAHQAVAFIVPNAQVAPVSALPGYATSVAMVEHYTHLRFFPQLPAAERQALVTTVAPNAWILH